VQAISTLKKSGRVSMKKKMVLKKNGRGETIEMISNLVDVSVSPEE